MADGECRPSEQWYRDVLKLPHLYADRSVGGPGGGQTLPDRSRPLCPYPSYAHFSGGDGADADSYECRMP